MAAQLLRGEDALALDDMMLLHVPSSESDMSVHLRIRNVHVKYILKLFCTDWFK